MEKDGQVVLMDVVQTENHLEKVMMQLNRNQTVEMRRVYMGAVIDTLKDLGHITEETRSALYPKYSN